MRHMIPCVFQLDSVLSLYKSIYMGKESLSFMLLYDDKPYIWKD